MVSRKNLKSKYALISVYNKSGLKKLCFDLNKIGYSFISTGNTSKKIRAYGYKTYEISEITKSKEIMDGRVKTFDTKIYASILYIRDNKKHEKQFKKLKMLNIDLVVINLYPFQKISKNIAEDKLIEMIDIGGVSLLRASSKNYKYVTTIFNYKDYEKLNRNLIKNNGRTDIIFRREMAKRAFKTISEYDDNIYKWFSSDNKNSNKKKLRYGENPNQTSFILENKKNLISDIQISGKDISYNNIIDVDSGLKCLGEFATPTCVIVKHNNPCGVASAKTINIAFKKSIESDPLSAFGGIVLLNRKVNRRLSEKINNIFLEIVVAPDFDKKSIEILSKKKNLILLKIKEIKIQNQEYRSTIFGDIYQKRDNSVVDKNFFKLVTKFKISKKYMEDLIFSTKVVKHLKSNAIVLSSNMQTVGLGNGQTNRIEALKIAIDKYRKNFKGRKIVCASDGFFPFIDSLKLLKKYNCKVVSQPYGSINDQKIVSFANKNKFALYFTKNRLFKH